VHCDFVSSDFDYDDNSNDSDTHRDDVGSNLNYQRAADDNVTAASPSEFDTLSSQSEGCMDINNDNRVEPDVREPSLSGVTAAVNVAHATSSVRSDYM